MANPNLALRRMAKNPFYYVKEFATHDEAEPFADELRARGFEVRIVPIRNKFQKRRTWRVMKRESLKATRTPRPANYTETPVQIVDGCVVQKLPPDEADNLYPYKWEVIAPVGHRVAGYQTTSLRRCTKKEALEIVRFCIEEGDPQ